MRSIGERERESNHFIFSLSENIVYNKRFWVLMSLSLNYVPTIFHLLVFKLSAALECFNPVPYEKTERFYID